MNLFKLKTLLPRERVELATYCFLSFNFIKENLAIFIGISAKEIQNILDGKAQDVNPVSLLSLITICNNALE